MLTDRPTEKEMPSTHNSNDAKSSASKPTSTITYQNKGNLTTITLPEPTEYHSIKVMRGRNCKAKLYFRKVIINEKSQWVASAIDILNLVLQKKITSPSNYFNYAGLGSRPGINFNRRNGKTSDRHVFLTADDALAVLSYTITKRSEQSCAHSANVIIKELLVEDPVAKSQSWIDNIQNKTEISIPSRMSTLPLPTLSSSASASTTSIARETSATATHSAIRQQLSDDAKNSGPESKSTSVTKYHAIKIFHEDTLITNLRFAQEIIDKKLQWVVAGLELAYILSPITNMKKSISSYNITQLAGVKSRDSVSFGFSQRQRPLTAYDACQYLNHIINTYNNKSIETNALQFLIQLLTIDIDGPSLTAIWKSDLTKISTLTLPYPTPWFNEIISRTSNSIIQKSVNKILLDSHSSISSTKTIALPQDLVATAKCLLSSLFPPAPAAKLAATKPSTFHSTKTNVAPAATNIMSEKLKTYFTIAAHESKKSLGTIESTAPHRQYDIKAMNGHSCKTSLSFREIIINKKSQLVIRAIDFINALLPKKASAKTHYLGYAGIKHRSCIEFKISHYTTKKHTFFTADDALVFLNYILTKRSEQSCIDSAYAMIEELFVEDPISKSLTWIDNIKNKTSISLQPLMSMQSLSVNASTTSSTTSITRETSITTTNLEDKNSINKKSISDNPAYGFEYDDGDGLVNYSSEQFDHWQRDLPKLTAPETTSSSHSAIGQQLSTAAMPSPRFSRSISSFATITPDDSKSEISDQQIEQFLNLNALLPPSDESPLSATETHTPHLLESVSTNSCDKLPRSQPNSPLSLNSSSYFFSHPATTVMRSDSHHGIKMDRQEEDFPTESASFSLGKRNRNDENKDKGPATKIAKT